MFDFYDASAFDSLSEFLAEHRNYKRFKIDFGGKEIKYPKEFTPGNFHAEQLTIRNAVFIEPLLFRDIDLGYGIEFIDCMFRSHLHLKNCGSDPQKIELYNSYSLRFQGCTLSIIMIDGACDPYKEIKIENSVVKRLFLHHLEFVEFAGLTIKDCEIIERLEIYSTDLGSGLEFHNAKIHADIRIDNVRVKYLRILNSEFFGDVNMHTLVCTSDANVTFSTFHKTVRCDVLHLSAEILFSNVNFRGVALFVVDEFEKGKPPSLNINSIQSPLGINISSASGGFEALRIFCSDDQSGSISFEDCEIQNCHLTGENQDMDMRFRNVRFSQLVMEKFTNHSGLSFHSCSTSIGGDASIIAIKDSSLGKSQFFNFSFRSFHHTIILNSMLSEIQTTSVSWFEGEKLIASDHNGLSKGRSEVYRQLKLASMKQSDIMQMLEFRSLELRERELQLRQLAQILIIHILRGKKTNENGQLADWPTSLWSILGSYISLLLGRTNHHGQDWLLPMALVFIITVMLYPLFVVLAAPELSFSVHLSAESWAMTQKVMSDYLPALPQLFNPVRVPARLFPPSADLNVWVYSLDTIHRIVLAFFIFQIITAFRKYLK